MKRKLQLVLPALALCTAPLLAPSAQAADESAERGSPGLNASRAVMDPDSKRLRAPERDEPVPGAAGTSARSASPAASMLRSANAQRFQQQQMFGKDGATETMRLDLAKSLRFTVARRDADGKLAKDCVVGEDAAAQRMTQAPIAKGGSHE
jgi:hypothetical protein